MKKNKYVSPEMEIIEMTTQCGILMGSDETTGGAGDPNNKPWGVKSIDED